ncbi:hypothetical protein BDV34DRAFT_203560 [Aspergillus parasiticus]|uniref:Uncharacterized protein n=1 Tax=Aspergillus parasiticus TaxID=5067 RepID=A0A5N6D7F5_ASPPA|nr:hypothetical protein BDV34DRAFT_203560 [Aspergillus parasiticus]
MVGIRSNYLWCGYGSSTLETGIEFQIVRVADGWESVISFDFLFFSLFFYFFVFARFLQERVNDWDCGTGEFCADLAWRLMEYTAMSYAQTVGLAPLRNATIVQISLTDDDYYCMRFRVQTRLARVWRSGIRSDQEKRSPKQQSEPPCGSRSSNVGQMKPSLHPPPEFTSGMIYDCRTKKKHETVVER